MRLTGRPVVFAMCLGQLGNLLPHVAVPAVMPQHLMPLWTLSGTQAGMMASAFAFGYMLAVPLLTTLTDRIDARRRAKWSESETCKLCRQSPASGTARCGFRFLSAAMTLSGK